MAWFYIILVFNETSKWKDHIVSGGPRRQNGLGGGGQGTESLPCIHFSYTITHNRLKTQAGMEKPRYSLLIVSTTEQFILPYD